MQITTTKNTRGFINTDSVDIKRIKKEYYKELYVHKFDNLDKIHQLLEKHKLPKFI